jgi:membrane protease YdiL (CAAX protease family)
MTSVTTEKPRRTLSWSGWFAVAVAFAPFAIKRAIFLGQHDYIVWLTADYTARIVSLAGVAMAWCCGLLVNARAPARIVPSLLVFVALLASELSVQKFVSPFLDIHLNYLKLSPFPDIPDPFLRYFDLTLGLLLVALSEESVFRALLMSLLERLRINPILVVLLSAAAFASIHLTSGLAITLNAFLHGLLLGAAYWWTRRLTVCIASHYLVDLYVFG